MGRDGWLTQTMGRLWDGKHNIVVSQRQEGICHRPLKWCIYACESWTLHDCSGLNLAAEKPHGSCCTFQQNDLCACSGLWPTASSGEGLLSAKARPGRHNAGQVRLLLKPAVWANFVPLLEACSATGSSRIHNEKLSEDLQA